MDFAHLVEGEIREIIQCRVAVIAGRNENVVDIEQQSAASTTHNGTDEIRLAHARIFEGNVSRRILQQNLLTERVLDLVNVRAHMVKRGLGVRQRQEVVEKRRLMGGPGK